MRRTVLLLLAAAVMLFGSARFGLAEALLAKIDISRQTMTVSQSGQIMYRWKVSTARQGYFTPRGTYRPTRLHRMWHSRKYHNSPMPHSVFFHGGYAIHGTYSTRLIGRPASHGCVRLDPSNAATFYALVKETGASNTRILLVN